MDDDMNPISHTPRRPAFALAALLLLLAAGLAAARPEQASTEVYTPVVVGPPAFAMIPVGDGFNQVTEVTHAGDGRLFIAERGGVVKILHPDGHTNVFLDIRHKVISHRGEYGFFDIVFHPDYADPASPNRGLFYVSYTTGSDDGVTLDVDFIIARFRVSADPDVADPATETMLLKEKQSFDVHKGGGMEFDPRDHMLYVGMGDDRLLLIAQSDRSPKGKIIRLDVDSVPPELVGDGRGYVSDEIWALGLRNPWKFDVDVPGNQIYVGEVGDLLWEEVNIVPLSLAGFNYGWPCMEGPFVIPEANDIPECAHPGLFHRAIHEYPHRDGSGRCAVIAGKVNRPYYNPNDGRFIFADMCTREIFALTYNGGAWDRSLLGIHDGALISVIGEGVDGVQYVGTVAASGPIYRLYIP
jgi:glucose/arabinose dehydrogenase